MLNVLHNCVLQFFLQLKLGHKEGKGLGKNQDGIIEPVEAVEQIGKRGLGYRSADLESALLKFDPSQENVSVDEEVIWLRNENKFSIDKKTLNSWLKVGPPIKSADGNSSFCDSKIIKQILSSKVIDLGEKGRSGKKRLVETYSRRTRKLIDNMCSDLPNRMKVDWSLEFANRVRWRGLIICSQSWFI